MKIKRSKIIDLIAEYYGEENGARLLDLGSDPQGKTICSIVETFGFEEAIGINPAVKDAVEGHGWKIIQEDARNLPFPDEYFDLIVSVAAFEHFYDLDIALSEAYRVIKKGGRLITAFGPIWSGCWGHHLWVKSGGSLYTYQNTELLPPWCHLLMSQEELSELLSADLDTAIIKDIVSFVYESDEQNRLFYDDYVHIINNSNFDTIILSGVSNKGKRRKYDQESFEQAEFKLKEKYPNHNGFEFDAIVAVLERPTD